MVDLLLQRGEGVGDDGGGLLLQLDLLLHLDLALLALGDLAVALLEDELRLVEVVDEVLAAAALHQPLLQRSDLVLELLSLVLLLFYGGLGQYVFVFYTDCLLLGCNMNVGSYYCPSNIT